ncbi:MAG: phosphatase PAP2 family protein, partial [Dermatophilaceae bacterium]|nr:phosphatase PAP2 family protein [Dermatophilaceae bacterium]
MVLAPVVVGLALLALARGGWRRALAGALIPSASTVAALGIPLQTVLGTATDAFPSHHAAAGIGLLVGLGVVWPRPVGRRWLVALAVAAFLVGLGNVSWYAHQPRDVVG